MNAGAHLANAAGGAIDAQRLLLSAIHHLEAADAETPAIDELLAEVAIEDVDVAFLLEELGVLADNLQRLADAYGNREFRRAIERRAAARRGCA
jgi:hypothetical protein